MSIFLISLASAEILYTLTNEDYSSLTNTQIANYMSGALSINTNKIKTSLDNIRIYYDYIVVERKNDTHINVIQSELFTEIKWSDLSYCYYTLTNMDIDECRNILVYSSFEILNNETKEIIVPTNEQALSIAYEEYQRAIKLRDDLSRNSIIENLVGGIT